MCHSGLVSASLMTALLALDAELAAEVHSAGCLICGERLHRASYPRKPRGAPAGIDASALERRLSFCCADRDCRRRVTPPSVVFLDRRVYVSVVVALTTILLHGATPRRLRDVARQFEVDRRTLERWREWWTQQVPQMDVWTVLRGRFARQPDLVRLPASLYEQIVGSSDDDRLTKLLNLLRALGHSALMRARSALVSFGTPGVRRGRSNR